MIWIVVIETTIILIMGLMIWDTRRAMQSLIRMWEDEMNKQWLEMMKESGSEIVKIKPHSP